MTPCGFQRRKSMGQRRPNRALEVIVIDIEIETARLVAVDEPAGVTHPFGAKSEPIQVLYIRKTLEWISAGKVVLEASQRRHRQRHVRHLAYPGCPRASRVDKSRAGQRFAVVQSNRSCGTVHDIDVDDPILHEYHTKRLRFAPESLQKAVRVAPSVARRMNASAQIIDTHRWETLL